MPASLDGMALGLIETRGYVGVIAAADAAAKAAPVEVRSVERASGGLILITLVGDVASVQAAVAAGVDAVASVGCLVSSHVIPRPDAEVWRILGHQERAVTRSGPDHPAGSVPLDDLEALPVRELRRRARGMPGISLSGRQISAASKKELVAAIRRATGEL